MIKVENLTKSYGTIEALRGVSFEVGAGEIVGLLGPNGAGKSTTIKILTGCLHPDEGSVTIDELDVLTHPREVQARLGYLSENTPLYPNLSVQSYLKLMADIREIPEGERPRLLSEAIYATGMSDYRTRLISQLSKGLRQRTGLAQAILHKPKLLILDEPTVGLDPTQIVEIRHLIKRLAEHSTILFSSHILSEVEALCDRVIIIINGQVRADARLDELSATSNTILVLGEAAPQVETTLGAINTVNGVESFTTREGFPAYRVNSERDIASDVYETAKAHQWALRELRRDVQTLETVFNQLATTD
ncbi:MAG: ATP-binding cassette domain-containing protein [Anaerolinea sp.]|nr:ATP-binding cassette domain-containing protein [Anaerolinea sp.]MCC6972373.1 ATP-binding cassette domain-containing protein [Anaerolineae bacterium]